MLKESEIQKILDNNPHIDSEALKEGTELAEQLKHFGVSNQGNFVLLPYAGYKVRTIGSASTRHTPHLRK